MQIEWIESPALAHLAYLLGDGRMAGWSSVKCELDLETVENA